MDQVREVTGRPSTCPRRAGWLPSDDSSICAVMGLPTLPGRSPVVPWPPVLAVRGPGFRSELHSHHSLHFVLAIDGELLFRASAHAPWSSVAGVLTASNAPHAIDCDGVEVLLLFLDPHGEAGASFQAVLGPAVRCLSGEERSALVRQPVPGTTSRAEEWVQAAARALHLPVPPVRPPLHPSVRKLLVV